MEKKENRNSSVSELAFSIHRFKLSFDLSTVKGFYLKNSADFLRAALPDSP